MTEKYGLEVGLWKALRGGGGGGAGKGSRGTDAKALLKKYGSAYLVTSISFAVVSFSLCYALVSAGVDVAMLLGKLGIDAGGGHERVGTVALAYAAHKAASPIRFPPTVALTPVVAQWMGKNVEQGDAEAGGGVTGTSRAYPSGARSSRKSFKMNIFGFSHNYQSVGRPR